MGLIILYVNIPKNPISQIRKIWFTFTPQNLLPLEHQTFFNNTAIHAAQHAVPGYGLPEGFPEY